MSMHQLLAQVARKKVGGGFPTVESVTETASLSAATSHNINYPATVNSGDLLVLICSFASTSGTTTTPTGYTALYSLTGSGHLLTGGVFVKSAGGTEGGGTVSVSHGNGAGSGQIYRITGWSGTIGEVEATNGSSGLGSTPDPPSHTLSSGAANNLWIAVAHCKDDEATVSAYPSGYTNGTATAGTARTNTCRKESTSASEDPGAFTLSESERRVAATIGIPPAA